MSADWIVPGADIVLVYYTDRAGPRLNKPGKVVTVAAKSFKVDVVDERFNLETLWSKDFGDSWSSRFYRVIQPGSDEHQKLLAAARLSAAIGAAGTCVEHWQRRRDDRDRITAAIDALTALRDSLDTAGGAS